jgi:hypothetical protein
MTNAERRIVGRLMQSLLDACHIATQLLEGMQQIADADTLSDTDRVALRDNIPATRANLAAVSGRLGEMRAELGITQDQAHE